MGRGRPIKFSAEELNERVNEYIKGERITLAGLALFLGIDRQTLYNYAEKDEFFDILKRARDAVEARYEERLVYENTPTGVIFALKNMGWKDRIDHTTGDEPIEKPQFIISSTGVPLARNENEV